MSLMEQSLVPVLLCAIGVLVLLQADTLSFL